jgi:riboflavin kinase
LDKLKPILIPTLVELVKMRAHRGFVEVSSEGLAQKLGQSQQAASRHLQELESMGLVERKRSGSGLAVRLTGAGEDAVLAHYSGLKAALNGSATGFDFVGKVFAGLGEGAYYIGLGGYRKQFAKILGFDPYLGTLNVKLDGVMVERKKELRAFDGIRVNGFESGGRTYGGARCFKATVGKAAIPAAVLVIDRTHYDDSVLEVISPKYIRGALKLEDGDPVEIRVDMS